MTTFHFEMECYECWVCGVPFGLSKSFVQHYSERGKGFKCPNGCALRFGDGPVQRAEKAAEEAKRKLEAEERRRRQAESDCAKAERKARRFKCPQCPKDYATSDGLKKHLRTVHQTPLKLPKDAGPNAFNSRVN